MFFWILTAELQGQILEGRFFFLISMGCSVLRGVGYSGFRFFGCGFGGFLGVFPVYEIGER